MEDDVLDREIGLKDDLRRAAARGPNAVGLLGVEVVVQEVQEAAGFGGAHRDSKGAGVGVGRQLVDLGHFYGQELEGQPLGVRGRPG